MKKYKFNYKLLIGDIEDSFWLCESLEECFDRAYQGVSAKVLIPTSIVKIDSGEVVYDSEGIKKHLVDYGASKGVRL